MCGITGFAGFRDDALLGRMNGRLVHRGPDDDGVYTGDRISLAMRRLSIIDLAGGRQPIANEDGTIRVVFNGDIYNYRELREGLIAKGHRFSTQSDTEVIVHLYEEHGDAFVDHLQGMFAIALADLGDGSLRLVRDRVGMKPLYYLERGGKLLFASELKALLEWEGASKAIDPQALAAYLTFLYVPSPMTIFEGIRKLPAGHLLRWRNGQVSMSQYWEVPCPDQRRPAGHFNDYLEELRRRLRESVESHLVSDVPLGLFLSGGLDSGAIAALMARASAGPIKTFSIGYGQEAGSYNELDGARLIAAHVGSEHQETIVQPEIARLLPQLVYHLDEPFADSSLIPTYLVAKAARGNVTVALAGVGGDELFGGYPRYLGARLAARYERLPRWARSAAANLTAKLPESTRSRNLPGWIKRFLAGGLLSERERYLSWISFYNQQELDQLLTKEMKRAVDPGRLWERHRRFYDHPSFGAGDLELTQRLFSVDLQTYLADDLLMMGDKMSMAASLELRLPWCDHRLVEFAATIPESVKFRGGRLKGLFREAIRGWLPPAILARPKQGFMAPVARWLQHELKPLTHDLLSEATLRKRGYVEPSTVRRLLAQHETGRRNLSDQLFALLMLELWHRIYLEGERW
jgi:asparagine synthase (glutamine-hydrolysing)